MADILKEKLEERRKKGKLLIPYLTFGYPDIPTFLDLIQICEEEGVDALEVGIPHSDPVADGPVIQTTSQRALEKGVTPPLVVETLRKERTALPLIAMTYGNIVYQYGFSRFAQDFKDAGFSGLIIADFPWEARHFEKEMEGYLSRVLLASVTSSPARIKQIARESEGFVYLVSGKGTTGQVEMEEERLREVVELIKEVSSSLVLIGFGVNSPEKAQKLAQIADGVIIGSALLQVIIQEERSPQRGFRRLLSSYCQALDKTS
ncbi:MAG TPA: tryptophan synthase subunit alpha [Candidatus Atribacteria bacterium]|jgi:tryptophan synthase alpha chain|nr:tryptophan synthase subunit alpha [Atribacterota bacterium]HOA98760.1 tryptophan synthase subunit alpha [Candidatus Atribacteria bacterium]HOQ50225.1 tryptophan synthase subunit alpha [Candidatus Atribacteria bacterium]HPT63874.1 tryptophan synthase subunit alpha [Candidatus Atribacteria bacterium]HPZ39320.1 tryptophan synthase subunit alpha [Candidatus Atribacteria bacterium]